MKLILPALVLLCILGILSCEKPGSPAADIPANKVEIEEVVQVLLDAVEQKDLKKVISTLSPSGQLEFCTPGVKVTSSVEEYIEFHEGWFNIDGWTIESRILSSVAGESLGSVTTEAIFREAERDGEPYYNKLIGNLVLEKQDEKWRIIKHHAISVEKSTDVD